MKVAYASTYDARNIHRWSGLGFYIADTLKNQGFDLEFIGPLVAPPAPGLVAKKYFYRLLRKRYHADRVPAMLRAYARQVAEKTDASGAKMVFSPGTIPIAHLECSCPIAFWTDSTFAGMLNYYPEFSNFCKETIRQANDMEQQALDRSSLAIYTSDWAAQSALSAYKVDASKVHIVPFGANIECDRTIKDIERLLSARPVDCCKLLFLGVEWERKGGDLALGVARELNRQGLKTILTIVGCDPPASQPLPDYARVVGFLSKRIEEDRRRLQALIAESHFLIVPSRAEAYGLVFCEANSYGVPCLSAATGGITTIIREGINGYLARHEQAVARFVKIVTALMADRRAYRDLALSSFNEYTTRLNWRTAGEIVAKLMREVAG